METRLGKLLGRYEIVAEVGSGAMGRVYKARDPKIDRFVAIKTISLRQTGLQEQREFRDRFFVEAQAAGRLLHPGIVTVFDVGEEPETSDPYIVMEYIEGQTLRDLLAGGGGRLPLETALQITQELAEALDYAHAQGVVHRDIKPANILVTKEGQAKISDFGIAQLDLAHITLPGRVVGTPAYMSPEQLEGQQVDGRSDLFSLGAILYCLVAGFSPFQGNSATTVCFKVANREPLQASALAPELPPELDSVIARAMAKDPAKRYQRGMEFALDLRELRQRGQKAPNPRDSTLWFSPFEGSRTWLDGSTKIESRPASAVRIDSSKTPTRKAGKSSRSLLSTFSSSRVLAGPVISLFLAAIILSVFASRQHRMSDPARTSAAKHANETSVAESAKGASVVQNANAGPVSASSDTQASLPMPEASHAEPEPSRHVVPETNDRKPKATHPRPAASRPASAASHADLEASNAGPEASHADPEATQAAARVSRAQAAIADSNVQIRIENHFWDATLSVWIDNSLAYEHRLRDGHKRRLILLGGGSKETVTIPLVAGQHELRVGVRSATEQYDQSKTISGEFFKGGEKILSIDFEKHSKEMRVTLQ